MRFRAIGLETLIQTNQSYENTVKALCDKNTIDHIDDFLCRVNRILDPETSVADYRAKQKNLARILLSAYLLKYYSHNVFTSTKVQVKNQLVMMACRLVEIIEHTFLTSNCYRTFSLQMFGFVFNTYVVNYRIILEADKHHLIDELYREYTNLATTKHYVVKGTKYDNKQKADILMVLDVSVDNIKHHIKLIDKNFDVKRFNEMYQTEERRKSEHNDQFWEALGNEIDRGSFENVIKLLDKIKLMIYDISPVSTKQSIKTELDECVDIDYINQKLEHKVMSRMDVMNLCRYIWMKLETLQSSVRDKDTGNTWERLESMFTDPQMSLGRTISDFFTNSFKIIDNIFCDVMLYPLMMESMSKMPGLGKT